MAIDKTNRKTKIGFWLSQEHQDQGIIASVVKQLLEYTFEKLDIKSIQIKCTVGKTPRS